MKNAVNQPHNAVRNVLSIMCDQLRLAYLSGYRAQGLHSLRIDALERRGARVDRAYGQGTGVALRMSTESDAM